MERRVRLTMDVFRVAEANLPTQWGVFRAIGYRGCIGCNGDQRTETAVALVMGNLRSAPPLVRIHSQCLTGEVLRSLRCDCRQQLEMALDMISRERAGVVIYEQQEGRGIGLMAKLRAYELQDEGFDTVEANEMLGFQADCRHYLLSVGVLQALGLMRIRLLSNNPAKIAAVQKAGIEVVERVPCEVPAGKLAEHYLRTKKRKLGHLFSAFD